MEKFRGEHLSIVDFVLLPYLDQQDLRMGEEGRRPRFLIYFLEEEVPGSSLFSPKEEGDGGVSPHEGTPRGNPRG